VFPRPEVRARLERMVRVTAYTDGDYEASSRQRDYQVRRFDTAALPFYAILDPRDDAALASFASMTNDVAEYVAFLDKGLAAFARATPAPPAAAPAQPAAAGNPVELEFPGLADGKPFRLSQLRGSWVLLNFWASWCAPCKKELKDEFPPALAAAPQVRLVTVAFDGDETRKAALDFAREARLLEHVALQGGEDVMEAKLAPEFEASPNLPLTYLVAPDGRIAWKRKGSVDRAMLEVELARARR
jgi:thiol:disulfide interchange protein DsbD